jgi:nucleoside-diphosphate-sugar epimerase
VSSEYAGRRVMVLGAAGFIGSWVRRALVGAGSHVTPVLRPGHQLSDSAGAASVMHCDLRDNVALQRAIYTAAPQVIFNLAGYGVHPDQRDEQQARLINVEMLRTIADSMSRIDPDGWHGARIVHTGTAAEYGDATGDLTEGGETFPSTLYGKTKLAGTLLLAERCTGYAMRAVTARLFTVYGPGERAGRLVPTLLSAADNGDPVPLTAGTQPRDFVHVEDAAAAMLRVGTADVGTGEPVNVATGRLHSVREFVEIAARVLGITPDRLRFGVIPERSGEMHHDPVNITRLQHLTAWQPTITPAEGIRRTRDYNSTGSSAYLRVMPKDPRAR